MIFFKNSYFSSRRGSVERVCLIFGILCLFPLSAAFAQSTPPSPVEGAYPALQVCDPNFYQTLENMAWMQTQREIQINQTVITKPASTLSLSCFDKQIEQAVGYGGKSFSDTSSGSGQETTVTKDAVNKTLGMVTNDYLSGNYADTDPTLAGGFYSPGSAGKPCTRLNELWSQIKCGMADPNLSYMKSLDYFRFSASEKQDIRDTKGKPNCAATNAAKLSAHYELSMEMSSDLDTASSRYSVSGNGAKYFDKASPDFCAYNPKTGSDPLADAEICKVKTTPNGQPQPKKCNEMNAVPTGVLVPLPAVSPLNQGRDALGNPPSIVSYWSYACLNPGCYFDVNANGSKIKFPDVKSPPADLKCSNKPSNL